MLEAARAEIRKATDGNPPPVLDPFCGGGSIPLEAQRLGLEAHACDLNPVAVLITKALIEIPPKFAGKPPVNPEAREKLAHGATWKGAQGLAEDVRYYGKWMRDRGLRAHRPPLPEGEAAGRRRGDRDRLALGAHGHVPEPGLRREMPLVRSFALATKKGKEWQSSRSSTGAVGALRGSRRAPTRRRARSAGAARRCLVCEHGCSARPRSQPKARAGRMGAQLMAIVAEGERGRVYLAPDRRARARSPQLPSRLTTPEHRPPGTARSASASRPTG